MLQEILDQVRQHPRLVIADDYELCVQRVTSQCRQFHNGEEALQLSEDQIWLGLRIIHRKRPGRSFTMQATPEALGGLVEAAFNSAQSASVDPWFRFPLWKMRQADPRSLEQSAIFGVPDSLYSRLKAPPEILDERYDASAIHTELHRKSERFHLKDRREVFSLQFSLMSHVDQNLFWTREERSGGRPLKDRERWLGTLVNYSSALRKGKAAPSSGTLGVVLAPRVVAALLRRAAPWFCADLVQQGRSPLGTFRGNMLFSGALTLVDDGNFPGAAQAAPFDMEGTQTQQTVLVDRGILKDFLYDTYSATRENRLSTGNFLRLSDPAGSQGPRVAASTLYFKPSSESREDLIDWTEEGIALDSLDSLEQVPGSETEYVLRGSGWRVAGGELQEPLWNIHFPVNLLTIFQQGVAAGNDLEFYGPYGSPSILFEDIPLGI